MPLRPSPTPMPPSVSCIRLFRRSTASLSPKHTANSPPASPPAAQPNSAKPEPKITRLCPDCAPMPQGLDIDHVKPLKDTMPRYARHVVIRTGQKDWYSRIEDEREGENMAKKLKELLGPKGEYFEPTRPILITNSSLPRSSDKDCTAVDIFPQNLHALVPNTTQGYETFVKRFLRSETPTTSNLNTKKMKWQAKRFTRPTVLICGHKSRDTRCGILGPILRDEFQKRLRDAFEYKMKDSSKLRKKRTTPGELKGGTRVALVSHVGGHAWAGNVIIYFPHDWRIRKPDKLARISPLAGKGVWYGRVEPRHVGRIVEECMKRGTVVKELLRGVFQPEEFLQETLTEGRELTEEKSGEDGGEEEEG